MLGFLHPNAEIVKRFKAEEGKCSAPIETIQETDGW